MKLVATADLSGFSATEATVHYSDGERLPPPVALRICSAADGYYLYYIDADGMEQTDTFHETLEGAFEQARFEFGIVRNQWDDVKQVARPSTALRARKLRAALRSG